ncbi:type II toxin-antitoxin system VapC family toxin [bacterium]|nr:type II toxin-antitoxin system VapC family toxin [bacterium]
MPKYLDELEGERIYVESNVFLFDALADENFGQSCVEFLERASTGELEILTASLTIDEIAFVALKVELEKEYNITSSQVFYLKKHPDVVKVLAPRVNAVLENIFQLSTIIEVNDRDIKLMGKYIEDFGLLPRDAIHLAVAHRSGISCFASNDKDFDGISQIIRYAPRPS